MLHRPVVPQRDRARRPAKPAAESRLGDVGEQEVDDSGGHVGGACRDVRTAVDRPQFDVDAGGAALEGLGRGLRAGQVRIHVLLLLWELE